MLKIKLVLLFIYFFQSILFAQSLNICGKVLDVNTKQPLAFVNIIVNNNKNATISDIDGKFCINLKTENDILKISYVGYDTRIISAKSIQDYNSYVLFLTPIIENLTEVTILPGENPAHRIILKSIENKEINNPENIDEFRYTSYNKMIFTFFLDSLQTSDTSNDYKKDSAYFRAKSFLDKQHMLLMESITLKNYKKPDKINEKVIASRFSGLKEPNLIMLATQLQSFSFYPDLIKIADKNYINPISNGSINKYFFLIEDTIINQSLDTIFVISFRPKKGKNFDALKGIIYINTNRYAIQNVKAEPNEKQPVHVRIQQMYNFEKNQYWFPNQLNTNIVFNTLKADIGKATTSLMAIGSTYVNDIVFNNDTNIKYNNTEISIEKNAFNKESELWAKYRADSLSSKDINTYLFVDSIGEAENLDLKIKTMETLMSGFIPVNIFNIDISKLLNYNEFEGWRIGIGIVTNEKLSKHINIGVYYAYGFKDKNSKYGALVKFNINKQLESNIKLEYLFDVNEFGRYSSFDKTYNLSTEYIRNYYVSNMDYYKSYKVSYSHRIAKYFSCSAFYSNKSIFTNNSYQYYHSNSLSNEFETNEVGFNCKFIYKEKFFQTPKASYSLGSKYPIIMFGYFKEVNDFLYSKVDISIKHSLITKYLGTFSYLIEYGIVSGDAPMNILYNGKSSYSKFGLLSENTFSTMYFDEFISNKYISIFTNHNFGKLLFKSKYFSPEFNIANNICYGNLSSISKHYYYPIKTLDKGFFETGLIINGLIKQQFMGIGIGAFLRYGPNSNSIFKDNISLKVTVKYVL